MYIRNHIIMDLRLVYHILAILNRLCVNCVLSVNLKVNKYNTKKYAFYNFYSNYFKVVKNRTLHLYSNRKVLMIVCLLIKNS